MLRNPLYLYAPDEPPALPAPPPAPPADPPPDVLGDAGKRALDAERAARSSAERAARDAASERDALKTRLDEFENANKSETERAIAAARKEAADAARSEVTTAYEQRLLDAQLLARAAGKLADPSDATKLIDASALAKGDDGSVDDKTIDAAIADLVKHKPYLAAGAKPTGPGSPDGGARGDRPAQLRRDDLKTMTPEQIVEARSKGQLDEMQGIT